MQTGDGLLVRLSPVSGGLSPTQLMGLCESAARHGNGLIEVTARGSLQFRGFSDVSAALFASEVDALHIDVRSGVPVETSPLAGMDPTEIADPTLLVSDIRDRITQAGLSARLGPKVSVVVDGRGTISLDAVSADIRLTAFEKEGPVKWAVSLAGNAETATPIAVGDAAEAIAILIDGLSRIADLGIEARARDLVAVLASDAVVDTPTPAIRTTPFARTDPFASIPLGSTSVALPIALAFGSTDAKMLSALARHAGSIGVTDIRPAPDRRLLVVCPLPAVATDLRAFAAASGFITTRADIRTRITACVGAPACASGHIPSRVLANDLAAALIGTVGNDLSIHVSGCEKGCARQAPASITLVGSKSGTGLVVNGTARHTPSAYIASNKVLETVSRLATLIREV